MLPEKLAQALKDTQKLLLNEGKLPTVDKLNSYYELFRERFGPEVLLKLEGEALLRKMHNLSSADRDTLVYWLEFKDDDMFPDIFGSIAGGSALKYGVYPSRRTGAWMTGDERNYPVEISVDQAIEIAQRHRDQFLRGVELLEKLPKNASDGDYRALQKDMDEQAPDVSGTSWGHKYFSLLYPEKLDDYHSAHYQRFHLVKLLQPNIADVRAGRYVCAGRFVEVARELNMPINHLSQILNIRNGRPHHYWSILASDPQNTGGLTWNMQHEGGFTAITWAELGNLSALKHDSPSKKLLREQLDQHYPNASSGERQAVFDFVTDIQIGDVVVALEPKDRRVMGIGRITSDYYYEDSSAPHRHAVKWFNTDTWQFPVEENFNRSTREILTYANQVEIERHLLDTFNAKQEALRVPLPQVIQEISEEIEEDTVKNVFISYRRKSWPFTHRLADQLAQHLDANIFVDYTGVDETDFERSIMRHLRESDAVVLIISEHTFEDRIHRDDDWVRREIRETLELKIPLILVCIEGRLPPPNLPSDIVAVASRQGINFYPEYFNAAVENLARFTTRVLYPEARTRSATKSVRTAKTNAPKRRTATSKQANDDDHLAMFGKAMQAIESGDFHNAVSLLQTLSNAGYKTRYVDIDELLQQAQIDAEKADLKHEAQRDYAEIVALASSRSLFERARAAFVSWCEDYAAFVEELDTENLRGRFNI